jgi:hypothetical protein
MFQTVGLSLLPQIAKALRLPLYTRVIEGKPVTVAGEYGSRQGVLDRDDAADDGEKRGGGGTVGDETEDLYELLKKIKVQLSLLHYLHPQGSSSARPILRRLRFLCRPGRTRPIRLAGGSPRSPGGLGRRYPLVLPARPARTSVSPSLTMLVLLF